MKKTNLAKALAILLMAVLLIETFSFGALAVECPADSHNFVDGFCTVEGCGAIQAPLLFDNETVDIETDDYYKIENAGNLVWLAQQVNISDNIYNAMLMCDIYFNRGYTFNADGTYNNGDSPFVWTPIGTADNQYSGYFDGNGKTVYGLYTNVNTLDYVGLFGVIDSTSVITDLTISNSYICGNKRVGAVCGWAQGKLNNCTNNGIVNGYFYTGGVVGYSGNEVKNCTNNGTVVGTCYDVPRSIMHTGGVCGYSTLSVINCKNTGTVSGNSIIGGVCGTSIGAILINSTNSGTVSGGYAVGGVCGQSTDDIYSHRTGEMTYCVNNGTVNGISVVNGNYTNQGTVVGGVSGDNNTTLTNCYNTGDITGYSDIGGVCGRINEKTEYCYNIGNVRGESGVGGVCGYTYYPPLIKNCFYLQKCARDGGNAYQYGIGAANQGSFKADATDCTVKMTLDQFADGSVTYAINNMITDGTQAWYQNLYGKNFDNYPTLDNTHKTVYYMAFDSNGFAISSPSEGVYVNNAIYQAAVKTTDKYDLDNNGINETVYEINNAGQLYWFAEYVNNEDEMVNTILLSQINLNPNYVINEDGTVTGTGELYNWIPIGTETNKYSGMFFGYGKNISGMYIDRSSEDYMGFFGYTDTNANIGKIIIKNSYINGHNNVGGVCGYNNGSIINAAYLGTVVGYDYAGGVCGYNNGNLDNCYNVGTVNGHEYIGGVCGTNNNSVNNCYYLEDCAKDGTNLKQFGIGAKLGELSADVDDSTASGNSDDFSGGWVTYNLNGGETEYGQWCQTIGIGYPAFAGANVFYGYTGCGSVEKEFVNDYAYEEIPQHNFDKYEYNTEDTHKHTCINCNAVVAEPHVYSEVFDDSEEEHYYVCTLCGYIKYEPHNFNIYSYTEGGAYHKSECICGNYCYQEHSFSYTYINAETHKGTCVCGYNVTSVHSIGPLTDLNNGKHGYVCTECGIVDQQPHTYSETGYCTACNSLQEANITHDKYDIDDDSQYDEVYEITNEGNLEWFNLQVNNGHNEYNAILLNDITFNSGFTFDENGGYSPTTQTPSYWFPIGHEQYYYNGYFDGNGKTIRGLYTIDSLKTVDKVGLFGVIGSKGTVRDVTVSDSYIHGRNCVGAICGVSYGKVIDCTNKSKVVGSHNVGGIAGVVISSTDTDLPELSGCSNQGTVVGESAVGGVCGNLDTNVHLTLCSNTGEIFGNNDIGGICGTISSSIIDNCYNLGTLNGNANVGGICGQITETSEIAFCYSYESDYHFITGDNALADVSFSVALVPDDVYNSMEDEYKDFVATAEQFAKGAVAYLLNGGTVDGTQIWYQNLDNGETADLSPKFTGGTVCYGYKNCGSTVEEYSNNTYETIPAHQYSATDNKNGQHTKVCDVCSLVQTENHIYSEYCQITNDTHTAVCICGASQIQSHVYGEWEYYMNDKHIRTCICGKQETENHYCTEGFIDARNGTHSGKCAVCNGYMVERHSFYIDSDNNNGTHNCVCIECGMTISQEHIYTEFNDLGDGNHQSSCDCGATIIQEHTANAVWVDNADGNHAYLCRYCKAVVVTQVHTYCSWYDSTDGKHKRTCAVCNTVETQAHTYNEWIDFGPEHTHKCTVCDSVQAETHAYSEWSDNGDGKHIHTCICGATETQAHAYGNWVDNGDGKHIHTCICGATETQAHTYGVCSDNGDGNHTQTCICGVTQTEAHTYRNWSDNGDGKHKRTCSACNAVEIQAHTYNEWTNYGDRHVRRCTVCFSNESGAHTYGEWIDNGSAHIRICSVCDVSQILAHTYSEWSDNGDGMHKRTCDVCDKTETQTHTYGIPIDNGDGKHISTCSTCNVTKTEAHTYGEWSYNDEVHVRICTCGVTETKAHTFGEWIDNGDDTHKHTCTICYYYKQEYHTYGEWIDNGDGKHIRACICGATETQVHAYGGWSDNGDGKHIRTCIYCDASETEAHTYGEWSDNGYNHTHTCTVCYTIESKEHTYGEWTDYGDVHIRICTACDTNETEYHAFGEWSDNGDGKHIHTCTECDASEIEVHAWVVETETPANCHQKGSVHSVCSSCMATKDTELAIDPDNHDGSTEIRNAVAATNESDGYTGDTYCLGCETLISEGTVIQKLQTNTLSELLPDFTEIQDGIVTGIDEQTTVGSIAVDGIMIYDTEGNELASDEYIGTGCVIKRVDSQGNVQEEATVSVIGDIDGSGIITTYDAVQILRIVAELLTPSDAQAIACDIDVNSERTPYDAVVLLQYIAGIVN